MAILQCIEDAGRGMWGKTWRVQLAALCEVRYQDVQGWYLGHTLMPVWALQRLKTTFDNWSAEISKRIADSEVISEERTKKIKETKNYRFQSSYEKARNKDIQSPV